MKIKEVIKKLQTFDENLEVVVDTRGCDVREFFLEDDGIYDNGKFLIITFCEEE